MMKTMMSAVPDETLSFILPLEKASSVICVYVCLCVGNNVVKVATVVGQRQKV